MHIYVHIIFSKLLSEKGCEKYSAGTDSFWEFETRFHVQLSPTFKDKIFNMCSRYEAKFVDQKQDKKDDATNQIMRLKWQQAGHVITSTDDRGTKKITKWTPRMRKCNLGRARAKTCWKQWAYKTYSQQELREIGEAFIQKWNKQC